MKLISDGEAIASILKKNEQAKPFKLTREQNDALSCYFKEITNSHNHLDADILVHKVIEEFWNGFKKLAGLWHPLQLAALQVRWWQRCDFLE